MQENMNLLGGDEIMTIQELQAVSEAIANCTCSCHLAEVRS